MTMTTWRGGSYTLLTAGILSAAIVAAPAPVATAQPDCGQPPLVNQLDAAGNLATTYMDQHPDVKQNTTEYATGTLVQPRDEVILDMRQNYYARNPQVVSDLRSLNDSVNAAAGVCAQDLSTVLPMYVKFAFDALP
jgi:hypothetical protein